MELMKPDVLNAAKQGKTDVLWEYRENLHQIVTPCMNTVLHISIACTKRTKSVVDILVMCPELLLKTNVRGDTALHFAAKHGRVAIVEALIEAAKHLRHHEYQVQRAWQKFIQSKNSNGDTALHEAVRFNHLRVVQILTTEDDNLSTFANDAGVTPLYLAAERGFSGLVIQMLTTTGPLHPLFQHGPGPNRRIALHAAVINNNAQITIKILEHSPLATTAEDENGWTPLHMAAFLGHSSIVQLLLDSNEEVALRHENINGMTPLHLAASKGHIKAVNNLLSRCPNCCELVDHKQRNFLHHAIENYQYRIQDLVLQDPWYSSVLLDGRDVEGNTPLHMIAKSLNGNQGYSFSQDMSLWRSDCDFISDPRVDRMAVNDGGLNALDMILAIKTSSTFKSDIKCFLEAKVATPSCHGLPYLRPYTEIEEEVQENNEDYHRSFEVNKRAQGSEVKKEVLEAHLVVAALIATVTFAAGITMPGGYEKGFAVLADDIFFRGFFLFDTLAFVISSCSVFMHLYILNSKREVMSKTLEKLVGMTMISLFFMVASFICGTCVVFGGSSSRLSTLVLLLTGTFFLATCHYWLFQSSSGFRSIEIRAYKMIYDTFGEPASDYILSRPGQIKMGFFPASVGFCFGYVMALWQTIFRRR